MEQFSPEIICATSQGNGYIRDEHFFRVEGDLVAYVKVHHPKDVPEIAYVIDTTSARAFRYFSPAMQDFYRRNGYNASRQIPKGVGMTSLDATITDLRRRGNLPRLLVINSLEANSSILGRQIFGYFSPLPELVEKVTGGGESSVATLFMRSSGQ